MHTAPQATTATEATTSPGVRMPVSLLAAAKAEAKWRDETLAQVVRRSLRDYVGSGASALVGGVAKESSSASTPTLDAVMNPGGEVYHVLMRAGSEPQATLRLIKIMEG